MSRRAQDGKVELKMRHEDYQMYLAMVKGLPVQHKPTALGGELSQWDIRVQELAKELHGKYVKKFPRLQEEDVQLIMYMTSKTQFSKRVNKARTTAMQTEAAKNKTGATAFLIKVEEGD